MGVWQFYWRWIKTAVLHSYGIAENLGGALAMAGGVVAWLYPQWSNQISMATWEVPVVVLVCMATYRFALAPFWMHIEDVEEANKTCRSHLNELRDKERLIADLQKRFEPRIAIDFKPPDRQLRYALNDGRTLFRIRVINTSDAEIRNAIAWLSSIEPLGADQSLALRCQDLTDVPLKPKHRRDGHVFELARKGHCDIDIVQEDFLPAPPEAHGHVVPARRTEYPINYRLEVCHAIEISPPNRFLIAGTYLLKIKITADDTPAVESMFQAEFSNGRLHFFQVM